MCVCVCGGGSEFSGAWGKRGEGGQGREGVQLPDSLMDEAVLQSDWSSPGDFAVSSLMAAD